jgi:hypothetical protein
VRDFFAGIVSIEEIKQALYFGDLGTQICLKSFKAFQQIIYVNNFDATVKKYYYSATSRDDSARLKYAKLVEESFGTGTVISDILED